MLDLSLLREGAWQERDYQRHAAERLLSVRKLLVVMPTALGKTFVAFLAMAHLLKTQEKKLLFLAPTKPLVLQQAKRFQEAIDTIEQVVVITGETEQSKRAQEYEDATVVFATPQTVERDVAAGRVALKDFALIVFDEAHRSVGEYAYAMLGKQAIAAGCMALGLTASPSSDRKKVAEVCANLGITEVEIKTLNDEEMQEFANNVRVYYEFVELTAEIIALKKRLEEILAEPMSRLSSHGFVPSKSMPSRSLLLGLRIQFLAKAKHNPAFYSLLSDVAKALNVVHAIDLLETEGIEPLSSFIDSLQDRKEKTKAVTQLLNDPRMQSISRECKSLAEKGFEHPKLGKLRGVISALASSKKTALVFAHYRDSVDHLIRVLNAMPHVKAKSLTGRAEGGMSQKEQHAVLEAFRDGEFNVLVATSVGEEGLDIPSVDLVVFFEAVPSEIRLIQRRGRAGRAKVGEVVVLIAKGTKDEAFLWISKNKEAKMNKQLQRMQSDSAAKSKPKGDEVAEEKPKKKGQQTLGEY